MKAQLMSELKVKRCLKHDVIPWVFSFGPEPQKPRISSENWDSRLRVQELLQEVGVKYGTQNSFFLQLIKFPDLKLVS